MKKLLWGYINVYDFFLHRNITDDSAFLQKINDSCFISTLYGVRSNDLIGATSNRPVIVASCYPAGPTVFSGAYDGTNAGTATPTTWSGYLVFPVQGVTFTTPESWGGAGYVLNGGILFKGGALKCTPALSINQDDALTACFIDGTVRSDRLFITSRGN